MACRHPISGKSAPNIASTRLSPFAFMTRLCNVFRSIFGNQGNKGTEHPQNIRSRAAEFSRPIDGKSPKNMSFLISFHGAPL